MPKKKSKVDKWLELETAHKRKALENASRYFDSKDSLSVNILESIYGQESSFGRRRRKRGISGAAGDFQIERETARRLGLNTSEKNDQRFDVDDSSIAASKYLKSLDDTFRKGSKLGRNLKAIPVSDSDERLKFDTAAYNAGEGRIAKAQAKAKVAGKNPKKWDDVKQFLKAAVASAAKVIEIQNYVESVLANAKEFSKKSKADKKAKGRKPLKTASFKDGGRWITKDGRRILIRV